MIRGALSKLRFVADCLCGRRFAHQRAVPEAGAPQAGLAEESV